MENKEVFVLDGAIKIIVRPSGYRSMVISAGLPGLLSEATIFKSDTNDSIITNFSSLVGRTLDIELIKPKNELASNWLNLWELYKKNEYNESYNCFIDLVDFDDTNIMDIWDDAVMGKQDDVLVGDTDLLPPEKLTEAEKKTA